MFTPILLAAIIAAWAFAIEKNTTTTILMIGVEVFLLLNLIAPVVNGLPAFLIALALATTVTLLLENNIN